MRPLSHWQRLPHMKPKVWALSWGLVRARNWRWELQMGEIYPDGSFRRHEGVLVRLDEPLPMLTDDPTAGRLLTRLVETGSGCWRVFGKTLREHKDWRIAVADALLQRWDAQP